MSKIFKILLPLLIFVAGGALGVWFFMNPDEAQKRPPPEAQALLVETAKPETGDFTARVEAMGQVRPAEQVTLRAQVGGEIVAADPEFVPGGFFSKNEMILHIDPADYDLAVKRQEAILRQAQADYDLEMGRQSVARDELRILERTTGRKPESPELALRGPQLEQAQAELDKARSDLEMAKLNLKRTRVTAPFDALVTDRAVTFGDRVTGGQALATLVKTDEYWVELSIPLTDLQWIDIPQFSDDKGSPAKIVLDAGRGERSGVVSRLTGTLSEQSRLATLLVSVPDPLLRGGEKQGPPLILGDYVKVIVEGRALENTVRIPLFWLRDGDVVWVAEDGRLVFRPVQVVFEDRTHAFIGEGLTPADVVVTSDIAVPVAQMKIRTAEETRNVSR